MTCIVSNLSDSLGRSQPYLTESHISHFPSRPLSYSWAFDRLGSSAALPWGYLAALCRSAARAPTDISDHLRRGPATTSVSHLSPLLSVLRDVWGSGSDGSRVSCHSPIRLFCGHGMWGRETVRHLVASTDLSKTLYSVFKSSAVSITAYHVSYCGLSQVNLRAFGGQGHMDNWS